jgi:23S rRNA (uridine2552-2'-O)-methyltransferase
MARPGDHFYKKAKEKGFAARSVFKLEEIDQKHPLYRRGMKVLDFGAAPGSWMQYASKKIGPEGLILGVDLAEIEYGFTNGKTFVMDLFDLKVDAEPLKDHVPFDLFQSDAMSKTTGVPEIDCARSIGLVEYSLYLARKGGLKAGGSLLAKVFEGPGFQEFIADFKTSFQKVAYHRPKATRSTSREVYVLGLGFKPASVQESAQ